MYKLAVGQPYIPGQVRYLEAQELSVSSSGVEFRMFLGGLTSKEKSALKKGSAEFGLHVTGDGDIFFLYRFDTYTIPWSDAPYTALLVKPENRSLPPALENDAQRYSLMLAVINADTGIVEVLRMLTLSPEFSRALYDAVLFQHSEAYASRWSESGYNARLRAAYARYPQSERMVREAVICTGGK